ncbi:MAG: IS4 family transposase [Saprospiraceae bacterium]|nr:IS4 family transposase [Saprospiraceae bacterium]MCB9308324.1 IS4 family transposase [Lewinellaceae bacterium]
MFTTYAAALKPHAIFGHVKTNNRFISLIQTLGENFGKSIPRSCNSSAETQAIYHFMNSPRVSHESILLSERDRVLDLVSSSSEDMIISIGDVSTLTYSTNRSSREMGHVGSKNQRGYQMLSQLICHSDGVPMGLLSQYLWNYTAEELGKRRERQNLPIEEKESGYYLRQMKHLDEHFGDQPARRVLHLFDRAGDIHELLQSRQHEHIHYIIRSKNDRKVLNSDQTIRQFLDQEPVAGCYTIKVRSKPKSVKGQTRIEKQRARKGDWRTVNLEVSYGKVVLHASNKTKNRPLKPVEVYLVRAQEVGAPPDVETIDWVLLTSLPVENLSDAFQIIDYYIIRWQIEVFHYILKQGALVEQL